MVGDSTSRFQILSLDGGGLKGLFSAAVLAFFEQDCNTVITDHFDLITGTSTGGIIALALGAGLRPREIVEFYVNEGPKIFPPSNFSALRHYSESKFSANGLSNAVKKCFGDKRLADSKKRLVIPSYNLGDDDVYIFKTPHHERLTRDYVVPLWKVAMATSAAPTFLPSFREIDHLRLIDGGVWANNPILLGILEATSMLDQKFESVKVLSLGTTDSTKQRHKNLDNGGLWHWRMEATDIIMRGQSVGSNALAQHLIGKGNVVRLNPKVPDKMFGLDKLTLDELISKAAHESRKGAEDFKQNFLSHRASVYTPLRTQS